MTQSLWAAYGDALKLILTGSTTGQLSPPQRTVFTTMLSQGLRDENGDLGEKRDLPGVKTKEYCSDEELQKYEHFYYIPDVFRYMIDAHGQLSIHTLPVDLDYLNSLKDESGGALFNFGGAPGQQEWLDTQEGKEYWDLLCTKIELQNKKTELETMHHGGKPSEEAILKQLRKETKDELTVVINKIAKIDNNDNLPKQEETTQNKTFIPYLRAIDLLKKRLHATPEELAAWVFLGSTNNGLLAYTNANEFNNPPQFSFTELEDSNYLHQLIGSWFDYDEVVTFQPVDRFITGKALIDRWKNAYKNDIEATEKAIKECINESRLIDLHPVTGLSQWSQDNTYPTKDTALFVISHIEAIEKTDGITAISPESILEVGTPEWRSNNAKKAADAKHNQPGGSRDKKKQIREIWETGKYTSKDRCAEEECAALDMSFSAARKALTNLPKPK